jgi:hypothetical protein
MKVRILCFLFICCYWQSEVFSQQFTVEGRVTDKDSNEALAFVTITYNENSKATISNIDGYFSIQTSVPIVQLSFSYVGYYPQNISLSFDDLNKKLLVKLSRKENELNAIIVSPGENPAHRLINKVLENRHLNNPEKNCSFSYSSYNKMYFTLQEDTSVHKKLLPLNIDTLIRDTVELKINKLLKNQYFFLMEFVSQRSFKLPDKNKENIISSRVSGFNDPSFAFLGTQMQSFGFYSDMITMLDKKYLSPISPHSTKRYFFLIEDTFFTETFDTLFVVSFKPKRGTKFEGLKGVLYINTNGYALQNVIAEPAQSSDHFAIRIQQRYELIDRAQWFPTQLNTDLVFKGMKIKTKRRELYPIGIGKSYLTDIKLNPDLSKVKFSNVEVQVNENAHKPQDSTWFTYRPLPLTTRDSATYRIIDSIGKAKNFDHKLKTLDAVMSGYIPVSIFSIDYRKYLAYNKYEGLRLGLGLMTNEKVSSFFSIGGYFAYGFHDKKWKYNSFIQFFPRWESDTKLTLKYTRDVWETAKYSFLDDRIMNSSEWYRDLTITQMDMVEEKEVSFSFRMLQYIKINLFLNQSFKHMNDYSFIIDNEGTTSYLHNFHFTETGLNIKFGFKEKFILTPSKRKLSLGTNYPMVWINLKKGLDILNGNFNYTKFECKVAQSIASRKFGQSQLTLVAGKVNGNIPLSNLYNGHGSYLPFSLEAENSFGTMRLNEFYSSEFISLFLKQNFGSILFSSPTLKPEVCMVTDIGFGRLKNQKSHELPPIKTLQKGYYESGLLINKIINQPFMGMGAGVFYRYGPYSFSKISDNFAYKMTLSFNF